MANSVFHKKTCFKSTCFNPYFGKALGTSSALVSSDTDPVSQRSPRNVKEMCKRNSAHNEILSLFSLV